MRFCFAAFLDSRGVALLDGGLATELERAGHDLDDPLWSAKALLEDPDAVERAHGAYLRAGADCAITATYQATFPGLAARGASRAEAERVIVGAVELAARARDRFWAAQDGGDSGAATRLRPFVAGSIGPYGAFLADGSEYRGDYRIGAAALTDFHAARLRAVAQAPCDILACETIPSFAEARALARLAEEATDKAAWFSFTCRDEARISDGAPIDEVADWADESAAVHAVGVNCVRAGMVAALVAAFAAGTRKPVIAYPNAGGEYDAATKRWDEAEAATDWGAACMEWVAAGAAAVGGCCRVGPADIRAMRSALDAAALGRASPSGADRVASSSAGRGAVR